ncbi:hypothetical protein HYH02_001236 [Chlamydomonas schloesseri]|uniref:PAS domain-containing protein n=1 Tax=Chlamydomonas schloesseri TaxID=2026947 RepID=A0A835WX38_9CHLO|nr:hypothetical protein HYH02_001236 [Chlamydomonas schloesseri]|eukprot:KAG2454201.1 hypothetical protein HYH02_001236 [Chlamydomonas schloesseri]
MPDSASLSSFGTSFGGSAANSTARGTLHKGEPGADQDEGFEENSSLQQGIFGVLYTVSKEHKATLRFAVSRLLLDFWQLWLLVVNPAYGFDINVNSKIWKAVSLVQLDWVFADRGYNFFLIVLYVLLALLAFNVVLSMWVAYQFSNNRFDQVWPIAFLRWFGLIFFQVLDIATLTLLLGTLDCHYMGGSPEQRYYNQLFPEIYCWSMPHLVHVAVSVVGLLVFEVMASAMVLSQMDLNPLSRQPLAIMHSSTEGLCFGLKSIAAIAAVMLGGDVRWLAVLYLAVFLALLYLQLKWVPATYAVVNYTRCATYGCVLYCSVLLCFLAFMAPSTKQPEKRKEFQHQITLALWIGMGPAALAGMAACWARLQYFCVVVAERFRNATPGVPSKYICKFEDAREVGVALRACRDWIPGDEDTLKPEAMALGEVIVKAGIMQLPCDPRMTLLYSSFLIDVQGSYQSGYTQLQAAKQQSPGLLDRFAIFSREQEHTQKASGVNGAGDGVVDLVSYVEFQRSHRLVTRAHKEALLAMRAFWSLLLHSRVSFVRLTHAINRIEVSIRAAERAYQSVLTRHGHNARLVRLYGRFLESVKFDPWAAAKWFTEADRLEEREEHAKEAMQLGGALVALGATAGGGGAMAVDGLAALFINSQGIIQVATPEVHALLGYAKGELKDRDVACIMPPPFGDRHNAYLRNYIQTGVSHVLDRTTDFVALTKTRSVVPIRLRISKVSGLSEDSVFMGVMEPLPPQPGVVRAWVMGNGGGTAGATGNTLIAAEEGFYDWLGYGAGELLGQPLAALVNDAPAVDVVIKDLQQALLAPPIATKATATAAAAVAAGRARRRTMDSSGAGVQQVAPPGGQQGQAPAEPGSAGVFRLASNGLGGDTGGDGSTGMWAGTASQAVGGFNLAALLLGRDTHVNAGNESTDSAAAATGNRHVGIIGARTSTQPQPTAALPGLEWRHKYSGSIPLTTILTADAFGSVRYVVISLHTDPKADGAGAGKATRNSAEEVLMSTGPNPFTLQPPSLSYGQGARDALRPQILRSPAVFSELMLVADGKGRLLHVTAGMAAALGRSVESVRNGGLAALMPEPYGLMHRPWVHLLAVPPGKSWGDNAAAAAAAGRGAPPPPPYSCRSGVTLSLCGYDESEGPVDVPFRMRLQQRLSTTPKGPGRVHVMAFERRTREQAVSERRMRLTVDLSGTITSADPAPASLFGVDPRHVLGRSLADLVDVFQLAAQLQSQHHLQQQEQQGCGGGQQSQSQQHGCGPTGSGSGSSEQQEAAAQTAAAGHGTSLAAKPNSMRRVGTLARAGSSTNDLIGAWPSDAVVSNNNNPLGTAAVIPCMSSGSIPMAAAPQPLPPLLAVEDDSPLATAAGDSQKLLTLLMLELSKRATAAEGVSWRVGVNLPADDSADAELQRLRAALGDKHAAVAAAAMGAKVVPAVMVVRMVRRPHAPAPSPSAAPRIAGGGAGLYPGGGGGPRSGASLAGAALHAPTDFEGLAVDGHSSQVQSRSYASAAVASAGATSATNGRQPASVPAQLQSQASPYMQPLRPQLSPRKPLPPHANDRGRPLEADSSQGDEYPAPLLLQQQQQQQQQQGPDLPAADLQLQEPASSAACPPIFQSTQQHQQQQQQQVTSGAEWHDPMRAQVLEPQQQQSRSMRRATTMPPPQHLAAASHDVHAQMQQAQPPRQQPVYPHISAAPPAATARYAPSPQYAQHSQPVWSPLQQNMHPWQPSPVPPQPQGWSAASLAPSLRLEVELWRADLLGGVLELDARGRVARVDPHDSLGQAGLVLGSPNEGLLNANIASLLPLPAAGAAALLTMPSPAADTAGSRAAPVLRGALKHRSGDSGRAGVVGPPLVLTARHAGDNCGVQLRLQAVRRTGSDGGGMYIVVRPHRPAPAHPGFVRWLAAGDTAGLAPRIRPPQAGDDLNGNAGNPIAGGGVGEGEGTSSAVTAGAPGTPSTLAAAAAAAPQAAPALASAPPNMQRGGVISRAAPSRASSRALAARVAAAYGGSGADGPSPLSPRTAAALKLDASCGISAELLALSAAASAAAASAAVAVSSSTISAADPVALSPRARPASSRPRPPLTPLLQTAEAGDGDDAAAAAPPGGVAQELVPASRPGGVAASPEVVAATAAAVATLLDDRTSLPSQRPQPWPHANRSERRRSLLALASSRRSSMHAPDNGDAAAKVEVSAEAVSTQRRYDNLLARSRRGSQLSRVESWVLSSSGIDSDAQKQERVVSRTNSRVLPGAVPAAPGSVNGGNDAEPGAHMGGESEEYMGDDGAQGVFAQNSSGGSSSSSAIDGNQKADADPDAEDQAILETLEDVGGKLHASKNDLAASGLPKKADGSAVPEPRESALLDGALDSNQGVGGGHWSGSQVGSEASGVGAAFGAGKRFKRLYRLLMGPPSQAHSSRLWWRVLAVVGVILVIHTVTFAVMVSRLNLQLNDIRELNDVGAAAARMHDIALDGRTLAALYAAHTDVLRAGNVSGNASTYNYTLAAGLNVLGGDFTTATQHVLSHMKELALELKELQQDIYLGKKKSLRMPTGFGFRDIWEQPHLRVLDFYNRNDNVTGQLFSAASRSDNASDVTVLVSEPELVSAELIVGLWRASNLFVAAALELCETTAAYVAAGVDFSALASYNFVIYNGMEVLWPAYQDSIDAVVQITISNGREMYTLMLIILAVEGVVVGVAATAFVWYEAQQFTIYHYKLYTVFVLVPMALVRGLANMSIELEPDHDDDDTLLHDANALAAGGPEGAASDGGGMGDGDGSLSRHGGVHTDNLGIGGGASALFAPDVRAGTGAGGAVGNTAAFTKPRTLRIQSAPRVMDPPRPSDDSGRGFDRKATYGSSSGAGSEADAVAAAAAEAVGGGDVNGDAGLRPSPSMLARTAMSFTALRSMSRLLSFGANNKVQPLSGSARGSKPPRRKLVASRRLAILLVLPFLAWSLVLVSIDLSVFATLNGNDGPIASLGILHTTISRLDRTLYYALDLAASSPNATAAAAAHEALSRELAEAQVEYDVLLHGNEALTWATGNVTHRPHLEQETRGIVWSNRAVTNILYGEGQCLCFHPADCQPLTSPYYQLTSNGLHLLVTSLLKSGHSLLAQTAGGGSAAAGLNATEFRFIWTTLQTDGEDGMYRLIDLYLKEVQKAYETAETKQVILFVLAVVWAAAFVGLQLRPFLRRARLEMRRIAELLSQLPPEVEVEALMTRLVISCTAAGGGGGQSKAAAGSSAGAGGGKKAGVKGAPSGNAGTADIGGHGIGGGRRGSQLSLVNSGAAWASGNISRSTPNLGDGVGKWHIFKAR